MKKRCHFGHLFFSVYVNPHLVATRLSWIHHQQHKIDNGKTPYVGVFQNLTPPLQIPPGLHRIGNIHEAVQMEKSRDQIRINRQNQPA